MGEAYDESGRVIGSAFGKDKQEVFAKLMEEHADAAEIRIRKLKQSEGYPTNWKHATIHLNPETGEMHSDGDHSVREWIQARIGKEEKRYVIVGDMIRDIVREELQKLAIAERYSLIYQEGLASRLYLIHDGKELKSNA